MGQKDKGVTSTGDAILKLLRGELRNMLSSIQALQHVVRLTYLVRGVPQLSRHTPGKQWHDCYSIAEAVICCFIEHLIFLHQGE